MVQFPGPPVPPVFPDPLRKRKMPPREKIVYQLDIRPGMQVLVIGVGRETPTVEVAQRVGTTGRVVMVDTQPAKIVALEAQIRREALDNVVTRITSLDELPLPDADFDRVLLVSTLSQTPDKQRALAEVRRVLKPDGLLGVGQRLLDAGFPRRGSLKRWCTVAGFEPVASYGTLLRYLLVFRPLPHSGTAVSEDTASEG